jgi:hypothetical protein
MAILKLPITNVDRDYSLNVLFDGVVFTLQFHFNDRAGAWFVSVFDQSGAEILTGTKVVGDWLLWKYSIDGRLPDGNVLIVDPSGEGKEPSEENFGISVVGLYSEAE